MGAVSVARKASSANAGFFSRIAYFLSRARYQRMSQDLVRSVLGNPFGRQGVDCLRVRCEKSAVVIHLAEVVAEVDCEMNEVLCCAHLALGYRQRVRGGELSGLDFVERLLDLSDGELYRALELSSR